MITAEQLKQFCEAAQEIFREGTALAKELKDLLHKGAKGRNDVCELLQSAEHDSSEPEQKKFYLGTMETHKKLFERILDVATTVGELPVEAAKASGPVRNQIAAIQSHLSGPTTGKPLLESEALILSEATTTVQLEPCLQRFYAGMVPLALYPVLEEYVEACEAFLGHKVGSIEIGDRVHKIAKAVGEGAVEAVVPFVGAMRETWEQLTTSQSKKDKEELIAATNTTGRTYALRRLDAALDAKLGLSRQFIQLSSESVVESFSSLGQELSKVLATIAQVQARATNS
jgi:hypothetical protein